MVAQTKGKLIVHSNLMSPGFMFWVLHDKSGRVPFMDYKCFKMIW